MMLSNTEKAAEKKAVKRKTTFGYSSQGKRGTYEPRDSWQPPAMLYYKAIITCVTSIRKTILSADGNFHH